MYVPPSIPILDRSRDEVAVPQFHYIHARHALRQTPYQSPRPKASLHARVKAVLSSASSASLLPFPLAPSLPCLLAPSPLRFPAGPHSCRNATIGSTFIAIRAGAQHAANPTASNMIGPPAKTRALCSGPRPGCGKAALARHPSPQSHPRPPVPIASGRQPRPERAIRRNATPSPALLLCIPCATPSAAPAPRRPIAGSSPPTLSRAAAVPRPSASNTSPADYFPTRPIPPGSASSASADTAPDKATPAAPAKSRATPAGSSARFPSRASARVPASSGSANPACLAEFPLQDSSRSFPQNLYKNAPTMPLP